MRRPPGRVAHSPPLLTGDRKEARFEGRRWLKTSEKAGTVYPATLAYGPGAPITNCGDMSGFVALTLSLFPLTVPVIMFVRVLIGEPSALQVAVAVAGVVLVTVVAGWTAGKVFRLGILLTGKKGILGEIVRLLHA